MGSFLQSLRHNWKSGLTVSLVSMPLSISLAAASGVTPLTGIITAIWAGLVASIFGGSHYNIVGPTGALSGLIATYLLVHGSSSIATLTVLTGVFILAAYLLKLERYLIFIPSGVIHGFTLGVAGIIAFNQLNYSLGLHDLPKHEAFIVNIFESLGHVQDASWETFLIFVAFLITLLTVRRMVPRLPGVLILAPIGILVGYLSATAVIPLQLQTLGSTFGTVEFALFQKPEFALTIPVLSSALAIALIAILETMLSAKIADGMTHTKHKERKEMLGLGLANIVSGLAGGIPATAALARTSLNIKTGATSKLSATVSSVILIVISLLFLRYFSYIPMAVIAAILVFVAIQMVETEHLVKFYRYEQSGFWISILVAIITFAKDPIMGILFGTGASLLLFVEKLSHGQFEMRLNTTDQGLVKSISGDELKEVEESGDVALYSIRGKLVYINSRAHVARFEQNLLKYKVIILRLRGVYFIDLDGAEALDEIISIILQRNQQVCLTSVNSNVSELLAEVSPHYLQMTKDGLVFAKTEDALRHWGIEPDDPKK